MTPVQKIKHLIMIADLDMQGAYGSEVNPLPEITAENVDDVYDERGADWQLQDAISEFREGEFETGLPCPSSRHYESKSVAAKYLDSSYVGWTYWFGGGKHGEPEAIDWMDEAYDLNCVEEEKLVVVRTFSLPTT
jgi:hypothetical protein